MQGRHSPGTQADLWERLEPVLTVGSAIAWSALAISAWSFFEYARERRLRRRISDRLLRQVFPRGLHD